MNITSTITSHFNDMTNDQTKAIELAKKLKALAEHQTAFDGESRNAQTMLNQILEKHGLTLADLENEKIESFLFKVESIDECAFLRQIFASVVGNNWAQSNFKKDVKVSRRAYNLKPTDIIIEIKCALHEKILIVERWRVYWAHYRQELALFYSAFIHKNELYSNPERTKRTNDKDVDFDKLERIQNMMRGIEKKEMIKTISESSDSFKK